MFSEFNDVKYCINCDWLQFSVLIDDFLGFDLCCPNGFRIEILPGNNVFRHRALVWQLGNAEKWLTLLWSPYSRKIKANLMTVQLGNFLLYRDGIHSALRVLQSVVPCSFNSCGRIDICCDFQVGPYEIAVIRQLWEGTMYVQGKAEGSLFWHADKSADGRFVHCLSWGCKSSRIKVKLYNKSRELGLSASRAEGEKPWIVAEWRSAGFDVCRVWRVEFSICAAGQLKWHGKPVSLDDVASASWLLSVFCELYSSRFVVRRNEGKRQGHKNMDSVVILLQLPSSPSSLRWKCGEGEATASSEQIALLRKLMAAIDMPAVVCSDEVFQSVAAAVLSICNEKGMQAYFQRVYGGVPFDVLQAKFDGNGGGVREVVPNPSYIV